MAKDRRFPAEILVQLEMLRNRADPLFSPDHVSDLHQVVIDNVGEVVGRKSVRFEQDLIVDRFPVFADLAAEKVVHHAFAAHGYLHAQDKRFARCGAASRFLWRDGTAMPVVSGKEFLVAVFGAHPIEPLLRAETTVSMPCLQKPADMLEIDWSALALTVGGIRAADVRPFVPLQSEPAERAQNCLFRLRG